MQLIIPTVHLNGTDKFTLIGQRREAIEAGKGFVEALQRASPHGRDFYPQGESVFGMMQEVHRDRIKLINFVLEALSKETLEIMKK